MNVKNDISEELRSLSALVATISRETPYRAPEGYFLHFSTAVLERVQPSPIKTASEVPRIGGLETSKPLTFNVPDGYFEGFAQQVLNRIKAGSGPSAGTGDLSWRTSPSGAFGGKEEPLPAILVQAGRTVPYQVPEGYFDGLSPILAVLKDKNPYLVPAGYFNELAAGIVSKTVEQPGLSRSMVAAEADSNSRLELSEENNGRSKTRVISLGKRMNWMKYAAAAVVAGLIVTVGWLRWHPATAPAQTQVASIVPSATPAEIMKNLSRVSDAELQNYLVDQDTTLAQPVGNIGNGSAMATVDMDDSNLKTLLGDVSDGDLKQYMDEHGGASDIATN
jgi:hypothetical protein